MGALLPGLHLYGPGQLETNRTYIYGTAGMDQVVVLGARIVLLQRESLRLLYGTHEIEQHLLHRSSRCRLSHR